MKNALLSVLAVSVVFLGVARADTVISESLTGAIAATPNEPNNTAADPYNFFGGGNLYGTTATISFSIDLSTLATCVATHGCGVYSLDGGSESYDDSSADGIFTETVTAGTGTFAVSNVFSDPSEFEPTGVLYNNESVPTSIEVLVSATGPGLQVQELNANFFGSGQIPLGEGDNLADLEAYMAGVTAVQFEVEYYNENSANNIVSENETFDLSDLTLTSTPEPATVLTGAFGIAILVLVRHKSARKRL